MLKYTWIVLILDLMGLHSIEFNSLVELNEWLNSKDLSYEDREGITTISDTISIIKQSPIDYYGLKKYKDIINLDSCSYYVYEGIELIVDFEHSLFFKLYKDTGRYVARQLIATEEEDNQYKIFRITIEPGKKVSTNKIINLVIQKKERDSK